MKKIYKIILIVVALILGLQFSIVYATSQLQPFGGGTGQGTTPTYGQVLVGQSSGVFALMATSSLGISSAGGSGVWPFTVGNTNYGVAVQSTSTPLWFTGTSGVYASGTSYFGTTSIQSLDYTLYASMFAGADIGAKINKAYAVCPNTGCNIIVPGNATSTFSTAINFGTFNKPARLVCPEGAVLNWTGAATSTVLNFTSINNTHNFNGGIEGCRYYGPNADGSTPATLTTAIEIGGSNGAEGININGISVAGFKKAMTGGINSWNWSVTNSGFVYNGRNFVSECAGVNCGEAWTFTNDRWVDGFDSLPNLGDNCIDFTSGNISQVSFTDNTFDDCGRMIGANVLLASFKGGQDENPGWTFWNYTNWKIATSTNTHVVVSDMTIMNDSTAANTPAAIFINGGSLSLNNVTLYNNSSTVWPKLAYNDPTASRFSARNIVMTSNDATSPLTAISNVVGSCTVPANGQRVLSFSQVNAGTPYCEFENSSGNHELFGNILLNVVRSTTTNSTTTGNMFTNTFSANGPLTIGTSTASTTIYGNSTSTFGNGINLTKGCFSVTGTCISSGSTNAAGGTGAVQYANSTSFAGNLKHFWDNTNEWLGVGTSTPWARLSLQGSYGSQANLFEVATATAANGTATSSLMKVKFDGRVGFGGDPSTDFVRYTYPTTLTGDAVVSVYNPNAGTAAQFYLQANSNYSNFEVNGTDGFYQFGLTDGTGNFTFRDANNGVNPMYVVNSALNNNMLYVQAGQLAIGTTSPWAKLAMQGTYGSQVPIVDFATTTNASGSATTSVFRISANGNIGVASTTPWRKLSVVGTVAFNGLTVSTSGNAVCINTSKDIEDAGAGACIVSTQKAKHDIYDITTEELAGFMRLRPVGYTYNDTGEKRYGFIAEEVALIDPKLVEYAQEDVHVTGIDGKPVLIEKGNPYTVDYIRMVGLVTAEVQSQRKELDHLRFLISAIFIILIAQQYTIIKRKK